MTNPVEATTDPSRVGRLCGRMVAQLKRPPAVREHRCSEGLATTALGGVS